MSGLTLVCFAVPSEARPFQRCVRGRDDVRVLITGMGGRNADRAVRRALSEFSPACVWTCGFAGALDPTLKIGDIVFEQATTPERIAAKLFGAGARPVTFHCAERVAITVAEKSALRARTGATAVEMESKIIHAACAAAGRPCVTVRAISDTADEDLPLDFNALMTREEKINSVRLALAVLASPRKIPALIRLGQNSARVARRLADVLTSVLE